MPSPIYQQFQLQQQNNPLMMLMQLKQNPSAVLASRFNVPQGMTDPNEILQHLLNTNQVSQQQVNQIMNMRNNPQIQQMFNMK